LLLKSPLHPLYVRLMAGEATTDQDYSAWMQAEQAAALPPSVLRDQSRGWRYRPVVSIVMPVYKPRREWIEAAIESVQTQSYENWQLCLCCDGLAEPWLADWLRSRVSEESRIRVAFAADRRGIAATMNGAGALADGEYVTFLDQDDLLAVSALHFVVNAMQQETPDILYSDEDWMDSRGQRLRPNFKPDWSPELLSGCMYFGHMFVVRRQKLAEVGWFRDGFEGAQDYDLALRLISAGATVTRIARVLYHWRMHEGSTAASAGAKPHAHSAGKRALEQALHASGNHATVANGPAPHTYIVKWPVTAKAVSVVICSRTPALLERCLHSLQRTLRDIDAQIIVVEHQSRETRDIAESFQCDVISYGRIFNFADMNNLGAAEARHDSLLFVNDDVVATNGGWAQPMLSLIARPDIGIAGAKLLYPSGAIQHAGIALGIGEGTGHIGRGKFASDLWRWLELRRNVSAVTGACLAIRRSLFKELNGFDINFPVNYNDADLCLRARSMGHEVVFEPSASLRHDECATRSSGTKIEERDLFWERWGEVLERPDPFFTPYLEGEEMRLVWR
jgi:GT2 family glycosyltransferase